MAKKGKYLKQKKATPLIRILILILIVLILSIGIAVMFMAGRTSQRNHVSVPTVTEELVAIPTEAPTEETVAIPVTTIPVETSEPETEPEETFVSDYLPHLDALRAENMDTVGWIKIEGTKLDYPVMYTPTDPEKYLYKNFEEKYSAAGLPFIDANCTVNPESDNLVIYGHNMVNGTAFRTLMKYDNIDFWREHPTIQFDFRREQREYEILAAFYDRVYLKTDTCFKFYKFIEAEDQAAFDEAMEYYKTHSLYDTGVTAEMGDHLITLVTCAYHTENGRFVVVARAKPQTETE